MQLFKTSYNESYYNSVNEKRLFQAMEVINKVKLISEYKRMGNLLEVGCGEGQLLTALQNNFEISGIDISKYCVEKTNRQIGKNVAACVDVEKGHIDGKYDVIVAFDVLEHLKDPEKIIKKLLLHIESQGYLIFTVPNNYGLVGTVATKIFNFIDKTHVSTWKRAEWISVVSRLGLPYQVLDQVWFAFMKGKLVKYFSFDLVIVISASRSYFTSRL